MAVQPRHGMAITQRGSPEVTMTTTNSVSFPDISVTFRHPLSRFRQSLTAQRKTRVVALGSS
ncbi:hypothetical protein [Bradyrhizobium sp. STM 3809]|uniref:hypothetical protein n=1 Tax=Bradyrhizobium sp. STM 3809 TaxID=551936 RepID=UPI000240A7C4|nr:hypothetical protein [Bradyrhizobium sp. STM 3809]CCD98661.1 hypothetical protein BRAS3809_2100017 [Bradyrhizobium sp. STM 3809]